MSYTLYFITQAATAGTQQLLETNPSSPPSSGSSWWIWLLSIVLFIAVVALVKMVTSKPQTSPPAHPEPQGDSQPVVGASENASTPEPDRAVYVSVTIPISKLKELKGDISLGEVAPSTIAQILSTAFTWSTSSESKLPTGVDLGGHTTDHEVIFVAECRCVCSASVAEKVISSPSKTSVATRLKKSTKMELVSLHYGTTELINIVEGN